MRFVHNRKLESEFREKKKEQRLKSDGSKEAHDSLAFAVVDEASVERVATQGRMRIIRDSMMGRIVMKFMNTFGRGKGAVWRRKAAGLDMSQPRLYDDNYDKSNSQTRSAPNGRLARRFRVFVFPR